MHAHEEEDDNETSLLLQHNHDYGVNCDCGGMAEEEMHQANHLGEMPDSFDDYPVNSPSPRITRQSSVSVDDTHQWVHQSHDTQSLDVPDFRHMADVASNIMQRTRRKRQTMVELQDSLNAAAGRRSGAPTASVAIGGGMRRGITMMDREREIAAQTQTGSRRFANRTSTPSMQSAVIQMQTFGTPSSTTVRKDLGPQPTSASGSVHNMGLTTLGGIAPAAVTALGNNISSSASLAMINNQSSRDGRLANNNSGITQNHTAAVHRRDSGTIQGIDGGGSQSDDVDAQQTQATTFTVGPGDNRNSDSPHQDCKRSTTTDARASCSLLDGGDDRDPLFDDDVTGITYLPSQDKDNSPYEQGVPQQHYYDQGEQLNYTRQNPLPDDLAAMLAVTRLHTQGRPDPKRRDDEEITRNPVFQNFVRPCCAEFLGSMFYVIFSSFATIIIHKAVELMVAALAQSISLILFMLIFGHISGGHFNPAITVGVSLGGGIRIVLAIFYIICQFFGAFIGSITVRVCLDRDLYMDIVGGTNFVDIEHTSRMQAILIEMLITYVLVTAYLLTCVDTDGKCGADGAISVGAAAFVSTVVAWRPTKASMNPAKSFATMSTYAIFAPDDALWHYHYVYWIGPFSGAILAAFVYRVLLASDRKRVLFTSAIDHRDDEEKE